MTMTKKILSILILGAVLGGCFRDVDAAGSIGLSNVSGPLRSQRIRYTLAMPATSDTTTNNVLGEDGVIMRATFNSATGIVQTSSIGAVPYPCKIMIAARDGDATVGDVPGCNGDVIICGNNQFGAPASRARGTGKCETITSDVYAGSPVTTSRVYESVSYFKISSCSGGNNANDIIQLSCAPTVGLPFPITSANGLTSVCVTDADDSARTHCWKPSLISEDFDADDYALTLSTGSAGVGDSDTVSHSFASGDTVIMNIRYPQGL